MPTPVTLHRNYPNVDPANFLDEDVLRLVDALDAIDLDVHNIITDVAGKAATVHTHAQSDITGLVSDLAGKASSSHAHSLDDLSNVDVAAAASGHFLRLSGTEWISVAFDASFIASGTIDMARLASHLAVASLNATYAAASHTHTFASLTSKPTTVAGYGITDFNSLGDARWQGLSADLTAIVSAGNWKVFYTNGSGVPTELALGAAGEVLTSNGPSSAPSFAAAGMQTGVVLDYVGSTAPAGWLLLFGGTIGNAASGGTTRANADTEALFTLLWNSMADAQAPVSGGRGASAAADYAANKTIGLPDARGRVIAGQDDMGGTSANRLTGVTGSVNGDTLGGVGGTETHTLVTAEMPAHTHALAWTSSKPSSGSGTRSNNVDEASGSKNTGSTTAVGNLEMNAAGGDGAHNNVQPTLILNKIIKL